MSAMMITIIAPVLACKTLVMRLRRLALFFAASLVKAPRMFPASKPWLSLTLSSCRARFSICFTRSLCSSK